MKELQNGAKINTEFEVIVKPPHIEPTIPPYINFDLLILATDTFNEEINPKNSMTNRYPYQYCKYILDIVLERKSDDDVINIHHL